MVSTRLTFLHKKFAWYVKLSWRFRIEIVEPSSVLEVIGQSPFENSLWADHVTLDIFWVFPSPCSSFSDTPFWNGSTFIFWFRLLYANHWTHIDTNVYYFANFLHTDWPYDFYQVKNNLYKWQDAITYWVCNRDYQD